MGRYEMVVAIVFIVMVASVLRSYFGGGRSRRHRDDDQEALPVRESGEAARLRDEVKILKERLAVLERITVEKENSLERQIEALRDQ